MRTVLGFGLMLMCLLTVSAKKVAVLSEIFNPGDMHVGKDYLYIVQEATVFIYSVDNYQLVNKFGKRGEGPREFILSDDNMVFLSVQPSYLLVNSVKRIPYFSPEGEYLRERANASGQWMQPLGYNFVGMKRTYDPDGTRHRKLTLFNEKLELIKVVYQEFDGIQPRLKIIEAVTWPSEIYRVYENKIFVADKEKTIYVYDEAGIKLYQIALPFERIKVDSAVRERYLKFYREEERYWRVRWERLKSWFRFPDQLPVIQQYLVKDDHIYILTYHESGDRNEILVLDLKGNLRCRILVPLKKGEWSIFNLYPFDIKNSRVFQLAENPDTEEQELHVFDLK
jgi:hypothetical protein